jgi:hypothetical protein
LLKHSHLCARGLYGGSQRRATLGGPRCLDILHDFADRTSLQNEVLLLNTENLVFMNACGYTLLVFAQALLESSLFS